MLVFGDARRLEHPAELLDRVRARLRRADDLPAGLARHGERVAALVEAGELAQGLADADFRAAGEHDRGSPAAEAAMALTMKIAAACAASWSTGFADRGEPCEPEATRCAALLPADILEFKQPEGYAHYLLYPETYLEAARRCPSGRWQVIGVRSIGTSLACIVAAGLGAPVPITVRPGGHPFERTIRADPHMIDREAARYAVVDEGPGLSGSSIAAVVDWLTAAGIEESRIHLFASHRQGPGRHAGTRAQEVWHRALGGGRVHSVGFDEVIVDSPDPRRRLATWVADLIGMLGEPLRDVSGGHWRELQHPSPARSRPPVHPWQERRKFLAVSASGTWLVKFVGIGSIGERKFARGRALAEAGFTPEPLGLCHGFLVERWRGDARPLPERLEGPVRAALLATVARYLAFRADAFPATPGSGASLQDLHAMARANTEQSLGAEAAVVWDAWLPHLASLESKVSRVETDNRLHAWEWLAVGTEGDVLKTDAVDHAFGHDLVGCQDIAWDLAGASVEFTLSAAEARALTSAVSLHRHRGVPEALVRFLTPCYIAFQLGSYIEAEEAGSVAAESRRLRNASRRYRCLLSEVLASASFVPGEID